MAGSDGSHSPPLEPIVELSASGYKSLGEGAKIAVRPLTILAGANSSGKSSMIQPLLLLKQTLECSYDPGPLLLDGPNCRFNAVDELLGFPLGRSGFSIGIATPSNGFDLRIRRGKHAPIDIVSAAYSRFGEGLEQSVTLTPNEEVRLAAANDSGSVATSPGEFRGTVAANRWMLRLDYVDGTRSVSPFAMAARLQNHLANERLATLVAAVIHVQGLRGNPSRVYPRASVGADFDGTFADYTASVLQFWSSVADPRQEQLSADAQELGLTWKIETRAIGDTKVEIRVGRTPHQQTSGAKDLVNIADVGFGVSQALPVLVALLAARPNQTVYIEQPEIHLHPRAQHAMAKVLLRAANRGVRVIAETHSEILLLGLQQAIAEGEIPPEDVALHWFSRDKDGMTEIKTADLQKDGSFGDWPEDFDETQLAAQRGFLDAAERARAKKK